MRKIAVALASTSLVAAASVLGVTPAHAGGCTEPTLVSSSVDPGKVTLGVANPKGFTVTAAYRLNGCTVSSVQLDVFAQTEYLATLDLDLDSTSGGVATYSGGARLDAAGVPNSWAGRWHTSLYATYGPDTNTVDDGPAFRVVRAARVTTNATPEPVDQGERIVVKGTLKRADFDTRTYAGYSKRPVKLQFRTTSGSYRTIKTVTSGRAGSLRASVTATQDGCFRYVYAGNGTTGKKVGKADCVDVR